MDFLEKFELLPDDVKETFASNEPRLVLERACFLYNVFEDDIEKITDLVTKVLLRDLELSQFPLKIGDVLTLNNEISAGIAYEISKKIFTPFPGYFTDAQNLLQRWQSLKAEPIVSEEKAWKRVLEIEPWILEEEKEKEKEKLEEEKSNQKKYTSLSLAQALEKYPAINEQIVTAGEIKNAEFSGPVKTSVKNWIADYRDKVGGAGKHSAVERGTYLFQSENTKKLTAADRQKLGMLLKSLDEETPLKINLQTEKIVLDEQEEQRADIVQSSFGSSTITNRSSIAGEAEDIFEKFAHREKPPMGTSFASSNIFKAERKFPQNSNVAPKMDSFVAPKNNVPSQQPADFVASQKEEIFSIPSSKPPIGSNDFNGESDVTENPQGELAINEPKTSFEFKQNFHTSNFKNSAPVQIHENLNSPNFNFKSGAVNVLKQASEAKTEVLQSQGNNNLQTPKPSADIVEQIPQNPEEMSDEMLLRLYQEKKAKLSAAKQNNQGYSPYRITPASDEEISAVKFNNVI